MGWPASLLVAFLSGALSLVVFGLVMNACVRWYRVSNFEGKAGYAVVAVAMFGGFGGLVMGLLIARLVPAGFFAGLGIAWAAVLAAALVTAAITRALADVPPTIDGQELTVEVEIRLPAGAAVAVTDLRLHSVVRHVARKSERGELAEARVEDGRRIVPGSVHLFTGRGRRMVSVMCGGEPAGFMLPLPRRPKHAHEEWSDWLPKPRPPNPPWPPDKASLRFRVRRIA